MKKKILIENLPECIPFEQLKVILGKRKYKEFMKWMTGQTVRIDGVYKWDLERWLKGLPCID